MVNVLLDMCVTSELRSPLPAPSVVNALQEMDPAHTFLSVVTIGELIKGIWSEGRQGGAFETWHSRTEASVTDRILPVDIDVARKWVQLTARLRH
jgi:predicted nucleic acid-binding protein